MAKCTKTIFLEIFILEFPKFRLNGSLFGNSNNFQIIRKLFQEIFEPFDPRFENFGVCG